MSFETFIHSRYRELSAKRASTEYHFSQFIHSYLKQYIYDKYEIVKGNNPQGKIILK